MPGAWLERVQRVLAGQRQLEPLVENVGLSSEPLQAAQTVAGRSTPNNKTGHFNQNKPVKTLLKRK